LSKSRSVNRTFRLDEELIGILQNIAKRRDTSLNTVVRDVIRKAASDELMADIDMDYFPNTLLTKIMNFLPPDKVTELAKWSAKNYARQFVWGLSKEVSPEALIRSYETMATRYTKLFSFEHETHGTIHTMRVRHSRGPNWSKFYAETIREAWLELVQIQLDMQVTENEVIATFKEPGETSTHVKRGHPSEPLKQIH
jgi:hypothetical protein